MEFWVKLLKVTGTKNKTAADDLKACCDHVSGDYWLFEGEPEALHDGISFDIIGEHAIEAYGDLSGEELRVIVADIYSIDFGS